MRTVHLSCLLLSGAVLAQDAPIRAAPQAPIAPKTIFDLGRLVLLAVRPRAVLTAENLFLRKRLGLFQGRQVKPAPGQRRYQVVDGRRESAL